MATLRSYVDLDQQKVFVPASSMTDENEYEVRCSICAREGYVDEETYRFVSEAINLGLDNPFRCEICAEEYDDLIYED